MSETKRPHISDFDTTTEEGAREWAQARADWHGKPFVLVRDSGLGWGSCPASVAADAERNGWIVVGAPINPRDHALTSLVAELAALPTLEEWQADDYVDFGPQGNLDALILRARAFTGKEAPE